jgi:catechol 2,3-dioxygenase-like lactoylglutathione lyase family enzyme
MRPTLNPIWGALAMVVLAANHASLWPTDVGNGSVSLMLNHATITTTLAVTNLKRAREFYGKTLGLAEGKQLKGAGGIEFVAGNGTRLFVYERPAPSGSTATACSFDVDDIESTVQYLKKAGIKFEEYDIPEMGLKTKNGIATMEGWKTAWFKDPDGNILAVGASVKARNPDVAVKHA